MEEEEWVYPSLSFLAEFGGALGMFLGFSFMTIWDFLVLTFKKCFGGKEDKKVPEIKTTVGTVNESRRDLR